MQDREAEEAGEAMRESLFAEEADVSWFCDREGQAQANECDLDPELEWAVGATISPCNEGSQ